MANICPRCTSMSGSFFLHDFWHLADGAAPLSLVMHCRQCETLIANEAGLDGNRWRGKVQVAEEPKVPRPEPGIGIQEALRRMIHGPISVAEPTGPPAKLFSAVPILDPSHPLPGSQSGLSKATPPPKRVEVQRARWGKCAECSSVSCPTILTADSLFFCATCRKKSRFIPDGKC